MGASWQGLPKWKRWTTYTMVGVVTLGAVGAATADDTTERDAVGTTTVSAAVPTSTPATTDAPTTTVPGSLLALDVLASIPVEL